MSRAFVRESDFPETLPERPQSPHPNYVSRAGLERLHERLAELQRELAAAGDDDGIDVGRIQALERDIRYYQGRIERAIVVDPANQPRDEAHFGATVEVRDEDGSVHEFSIVGEDEADVASGRVSWQSPLAQAMIGSAVGDTVQWQRPSGKTELEILNIRYPSP